MMSMTGTATPATASGQSGEAMLGAMNWHGKRFTTRTDDNSVLGAMDRKGDAQPLYFYLQRHCG